MVGKEVVKSCLPTSTTMRKRQWCGLLSGLVRFRLVAPPLHPGVIGPYPVRGVWFSSHLPLEGTSRI
jgi:hypothetical protein